MPLLHGTVDRLPQWRVWSAGLFGLVGLGCVVLSARWAGYSASCPAESEPAWALVAASLALGIAAIVLGVRAPAGMILGGIALILLVLGAVAANACQYPGYVRLALDRMEGAMPEKLGRSFGRGDEWTDSALSDAMTYRTKDGLGDTAKSVERSLIEARMHPEPCGPSAGPMFCLPRDFDSDIGVVVWLEPTGGSTGGTTVGVGAQLCRQTDYPKNATCVSRTENADD